MRLFGATSVEQLLGQPILDRIHPDDRAVAAERSHRLREKREDQPRHEHRYLKLDGTPIDVEVSAVPFRYNGADGALAFLRDITRRKQVEEEIRILNQGLELRVAERTRELHAKEAHLQETLNALPIAVFFKDRDGRYLGCNRVFSEVMGVSADEIRGKAVFDLWPSELARVYHEKDLELMARPEHQQYEFEVRDRHKQVRQVLYAKNVFRDDRDEVTGIIGAFVDITERKQAEQALQERTAQLHAKEARLREALALNTNILMASAVGIAAYQQGGQCIMVNPAFSTIVGGTEAQLLQQNFRGLQSWRLSGLLEVAENVLADGTSAEFETSMTTTFGRMLWLHCRLSRFVSEGENHLLLMMHDVTAEKLAKEALLERERDFRTLAENVPDGIGRLDAGGRHLYVNPMLERILGRPAGALLGKTLQEEFPDGRFAVLDRAIRHVGVTGEKVEIEQAVSGVDGALQYYLIQIVAERGTEGRLVSVLLIGRDITFRKRAEDDLRAAKAEAERANNAKSRFLAAASHDLRQPLAALSLYVDALGNKSALADKMKASVVGLSDMLTKLLDLSKLEAGVVTPKASDFSLASVIDNVLSSYAPEAESKGLALRCGRFDVVGRTDPVLFLRIIGNLCSNAIRYTERGGVLIGCRRRQGKWWVEVWDTGIGIPADKTAEIFEEFRQLGNHERDQSRGSGLGLAIVAKTAALLGLQVRVQSRVGRGSMFAVELPAGKVVNPTVQRRYTHRSLRIALVEDNAEVAAALAYSLSHIGHEVVVASSGAELLSRVGDVPPDVVISDYRLAGGEDGFDVIDALRLAYQTRLPTILITGDTDPALIRRMAEKGITVHHKPVDLEALRESIAEVTQLEG